MQRCGIHRPNKRTVACRVTIHRRSICPHRKAIENSHAPPVRLWQMLQSGFFGRLRNDNAQETRDEKFRTIQLRNDSCPSSWSSYLRRPTFELTGLRRPTAVEGPVERGVGRLRPQLLLSLQTKPS